MGLLAQFGKVSNLETSYNRDSENRLTVEATYYKQSEAQNCAEALHEAELDGGVLLV